MKNILVVTTVNGLTHEGLLHLIKESSVQKYKMIIIGDSKTPSALNSLAHINVSYLSLNFQLNSSFRLGRSLPIGHYSRKNFGYLYAASLGFDWISETDDDNLIYPHFWEFQLPSRSIKNSSNCKWINIYKLFGHEEIWHRGIPIDQVHDSNQIVIEDYDNHNTVACIQGLANGDPDIDAICRILYSPSTTFDAIDSYTIRDGNFCPTNSQMTRWKTDLTLPLLYLPSTVPWRVSDIWRGLIAQKFFSISGLSTQYRGGLGFQKRNQHNLLLDFIDEIEVHSKSYVLLEILEQVNNQNPFEFMLSVYLALKSEKLVKAEELIILQDWLTDVRTILNTTPNLLVP